MSPDPYTALSDAEILATLKRLADQLERTNRKRDALYAKRRALFVEGRRRDPQLATRTLGDAAGCSDVLVTQIAGGARLSATNAGHG